MEFMWKCYRCKQMLPAKMFHKNRKERRGLASYCKPCTAAYSSQPDQRAKGRERQNRRRAENPQKRRASERRWAAANPDKIRAKWLRQTYGISLEQYDKLLRSHDGKCAICHRPSERLSIDHDHRCCPQRRTCGSCLRGLLCPTCNRGIGMFYEDPIVLQRGADYLKKWVTS